MPSQWRGSAAEDFPAHQRWAGRLCGVRPAFEHTANHDSVVTRLQDFLNLTKDRAQRVREKWHSVRTFGPPTHEFYLARLASPQPHEAKYFLAGTSRHHV